MSIGVPGPWVPLGEASVNKELSERKNHVPKYIETRLNVVLLAFFGLGLWIFFSSHFLGFFFLSF